MPLLPSLTSLPLPLILLLISIRTTCSASSNPCSHPTLCGNISVSYPFSLFVPYPSSNSYCGYPGLQIHCYYGNTSILVLGSNNYTITDINYEAKTISLVDTDILSQSTPTPRIDHNVSLTPNIWLNYTDLVINITFFFNCPQSQNFNSDAIIPVGAKAGKYSYVFPTAAIPPNYYNEWVRCEQVVVAPVLGPQINSKLQNLSHNYGSVLQDGFQLEWINTVNNSESENCVQCEKGGGECGYNNVTINSTYVPTCFCGNGSCVERRDNVTYHGATCSNFMMTFVFL